MLTLLVPTLLGRFTRSAGTRRDVGVPGRPVSDTATASHLRGSHTAIQTTILEAPIEEGASFLSQPDATSYIRCGPMCRPQVAAGNTRGSVWRRSMPTVLSTGRRKGFHHSSISIQTPSRLPFGIWALTSQLRTQEQPVLAGGPLN